MNLLVFYWLTHCIQRHLIINITLFKTNYIILLQKYLKKYVQTQSTRLGQLQHYV